MNTYYISDEVPGIFKYLGARNDEYYFTDVLTGNKSSAFSLDGFTDFESLDFTTQVSYILKMTDHYEYFTIMSDCILAPFSNQNQVTHIKTGNPYYVIAVTKCCTNGHEWSFDVIYVNKEGSIFSRNIVEFCNKFKVK